MLIISTSSLPEKKQKENCVEINLIKTEEEEANFFFYYLLNTNLKIRQNFR
jgi:hypothetical protein